MRYYGREGAEDGVGGGGECACADSGEVGGETLRAVCVDSAQVGEDEAGGDDFGVGGWDVVCDEEVGGEGLEGQVVDVDLLVGVWSGGV